MEPWIQSNPDILAGKPCVRGTRLSVAFLLELVASGATREQILSSNPHLPPAGLDAVANDAADALRDDVVWDTRVPA